MLEEGEDDKWYNAGKFELSAWQLKSVVDLGELVYEQYMHTIARQQVIFMEKTEDVTNKKFITDVTDLMNKFASDMEETVVFEKLTDEERKQQEVDAMQEVVQEKQMEESANAEHQQ